ncbi:MAG: DUF4340 domain-containing protein [Candidatus Scalindua sp. AMX11]|nr:MAG: DUF4340 domain-containing protein [Candidatus Scalindua sp.]NOG85301.1 DUF4340 domain-containing protein [Planctomycetota bacterium]RZV81482.1 MAG: DUF4340 domain-containing protein [Candidatus Scalindua sp. SCAELEC01]TDE65445.1 MAG: DUF4340 domain-containing protein [Candidatus Scalindua sp. AMX11]GJQ59369.1 MAG: hypothetical protein SCALA701_21700 [Candidatus Scalindua sp.]
MSGKKLVVLGIITACMIAWAVVQSRVSKRYSSEPTAPVYLIQGLDPTDIGSIVLGSGDDSFTLNREGANFVVVNKDNYPAITKEINSLITSCMDIRTAELYTENPANHKDLGVTEEDATFVVKFLKPNSDFLAGVIIGKNSDQGRGSFVRVLPGDKVYVSLERPWIKELAMDYIDREILSLTREDIESVTVQSPGETYTLLAESGGEGIVLENLPTGKKVNEIESEKVFTALTNLQFQDVKRNPTSDGELSFETLFLCKERDSTLYTIKIAQKDNKTYVLCDCKFTDNTPVTKEKGVESEEELKKKEAKLLAMEEAKSFAERHRGWVYEVPENIANNLTIKLSALLVDEEVAPQEKDETEKSDHTENQSHNE